MPLKSRIPKIITNLEQAPDAIADRTADVAVESAMQHVPVDTGALRTSIEKFGASGSNTRTVEAGQSLWYASFVEYGTSRNRAQPFMSPAAETARKEMPRISKEIVKDATN